MTKTIQLKEGLALKEKDHWIYQGLKYGVTMGIIAGGILGASGVLVIQWAIRGMG